MNETAPIQPPPNIISEQFVPKSIVDTEKEVIENTLKYFDWNISKCASSLGIGRNTLYDKIRKYNIKKNNN